MGQQVFVDERSNVRSCKQGVDQLDRSRRYTRKVSVVGDSAEIVGHRHTDGSRRHCHLVHLVLLCQYMKYCSSRETLLGAVFGAVASGSELVGCHHFFFCSTTMLAFSNFEFETRNNETMRQYCKCSRLRRVFLAAPCVRYVQCTSVFLYRNEVFVHMTIGPSSQQQATSLGYVSFSSKEMTTSRAIALSR